MIKIFFICSLQLPDIPITAGMVSCSVEESADDGKLNEKRKDDIFKKKRGKESWNTKYGF